MSFLERLRDAHRSRPVLAPGAYDALSALLVEKAGFEAVYISGASVAYTQLGRPDIGLVSFDHLADVTARIAERVSIPIVVDADTGFGNALNVARTVRLLEARGASAIQLEDQQMPKRCGHLAGKTLVGADEMVGKIKAALDARRSTETVIVARTDAISVHGFEAALARAELYREAGADVLFVEAPGSLDQMKTIGERFGRTTPLVANMVEGGVTPMLPLDQLGALGFGLVISPGSLVRVLIPALEAFLGVLKSEGATRSFTDRMTDLDGVNRRLGLAEMLALGDRYTGLAREAAE